MVLNGPSFWVQNCKKNVKTNEYACFGTPRGTLGAEKSRRGEGLSKIPFWGHRIIQVLPLFLAPHFTLFHDCCSVPKSMPKPTLNVSKNVFSNKGCMCPNYMIYRIECVCATSLWRGTRLKKRGKNTCLLCIIFTSFSGCVSSRFVHRFLVSFFMKNGCQNGTKIDARIVQG